MKKLIANWKNTQSALGYRTLWDRFWKRQQRASQLRARRGGSTKLQSYGSLEPRQLLASLTFEGSAPAEVSTDAEAAPLVQQTNAAIPADTIPGDTNFDGQVDVLNDAFALVGNLGTTSGAVWQDGDFNGDGAVDVLNDAFVLVGNLGTSVSAGESEGVILSLIHI